MKIVPNKRDKILLVHAKRGLFTITKCGSCNFTWECENCLKSGNKKGVNLVAYRTRGSIMELLCHQCQNYYKYPSICPNCKNQQVISQNGGIEDLTEKLESEIGFNVIRLDAIGAKEQKLYNKNKKKDEKKPDIWLTTRVWDPGIDYKSFNKIAFIQAQNLLASPDYLVGEEISKSLAEIFFQIDGTDTEIIFDTNQVENEFFQNIIRLNSQHENPINTWSWYKEFLEKEKRIRTIFEFPPFVNLILLTTHETSFDKAKNKLSPVKSYLEGIKEERFDKIKISSSYPARFLKRKNLFSYHLLIRYPRGYSKFHELKAEIKKIASSNRLQIRHNPRHLF